MMRMATMATTMIVRTLAMTMMIGIERAFAVKCFVIDDNRDDDVDAPVHDYNPSPDRAGNGPELEMYSMMIVVLLAVNEKRPRMGSPEMPAVLAADSVQC